MQVNSIGNINSGKNFTSEIIDKERLFAFVNMDDSELKELAVAKVQQNDEEKDKKDSKSILKMFYAIPIVDSIARGSLAKSPLSSIAKKTGRIAGEWALILGTVGIYNAIKKKINSNSPKLENIQQEHPISSLAFDLGVLFTALSIGNLAFKSPKLEAFKNNSEIFKNLQGFGEKIAEFLDKTAFNTKVLPKISNGISKVTEYTPWVTKTAKFALANTMFILLGAALLKGAAAVKKKNEQVEHKYDKLKNKQLKYAKSLVNHFAIENSLLCQQFYNMN